MSEKTNNTEICHLIAGDLWAGAEAMVFNMVSALHSHGSFRLHVVLLNEGILQKKISGLGVKTTIINEKSENFIQLCFSFFKIIIKTKPVIIHVHGYKETLIAGLARLIALRISIPIVRTHHGKGITDSTKLKHKIIEKVNSIFFYNYAIAVSFDLQKYLLSLNYCKKDKSFVIHNFINPNYTEVVLNARERITCEFNIPEDAIIIGTLGRLVNIKGHINLINAAKNILASNANVYCLIAGDGPLYKNFSEYIKSLQMDKNIKLLGFRADSNVLLQALDVFILPSLHEGIPLVLLEALFYEKPVIASKVGGIPEVVTDKKDALLIPPADTSSLEEAIRLLINNNTLSNSLAKKGRETVISKFGNDHFTQQIKNVYNEVLN